MPPLLTEPFFYAVSIPAVILVGLSKGGLGGAMAIIGLPLMALAMPPVQAAAIMLPILIVMDWASLWTWRGYHDLATLKIMLPGALLGIFAGYMLAAHITEDMIRLAVGVIALLFVLRYYFPGKLGRDAARPQQPVLGVFWGAVAGLTSFMAHAGGPPYQVYAMPLRHHPRIFTGTSVIFFAIVNAIKVLPYFALGQFDATNLEASAVLLPLAPLSTFAGAWLVKRMKPEIFYPLMYAMVGLVALKLVWDGAMGL